VSGRREERLGGALGLDEVAEQNAREQRHAQLSLGDRETERVRLGYAVDEDARAIDSPRAASV
jgi:hypothetical protein